MRLNNRLCVSLGLVAVLAMADPANAYMGPGLGLGAITTALGVVGALLLGLISLVWYPVKRMLRLGRGKPRARAVRRVDAEDARGSGR